MKDIEKLIGVIIIIVILILLFIFFVINIFLLYRRKKLVKELKQFFLRYFALLFSSLLQIK